MQIRRLIPLAFFPPAADCLGARRSGMLSSKPAAQRFPRDLYPFAMAEPDEQASVVLTEVFTEVFTEALPASLRAAPHHVLRCQGIAKINY